MLVEYGLGMWVSLYAKIPSSDHGKGTFAAFGAAVVHGPAGLAAHAVLGTLLLATAITVPVRAARARQTASLAVGTIALLAIIAAWLSGARFVGDGAAGESLGMAMTTAAALLCYVIIVFRPAEGPAQ